MKNFQILTLSLVAILFVTIIGCGGGQQVVLNPEESKVVNTISAIPVEYEKPVSDPNMIVGKGTAISKDMQVAVNKANLAASGEISNLMNSKIEGMKKEVTPADFEDEGVEKAYDETLTQITSSVIQGAEESFRKIIPEGTKYRAYIILQLPLGKANKIILDGLKREEKLWREFKNSEQVKEMERKVKEFEESQKQG